MDTVQLQKLINSGSSITHAACKLNASPSGVKYWVTKLGLKLNKEQKRKYTDEMILDAVKQSRSYNETLRHLGINTAGEIYYHIKRRIITIGADVSHFNKDEAYRRHNCSHPQGKLPPEEVLVKGKKRRESAKKLRRALLEIGRSYICEECRQDETWNGKNLVLAIDHKDGDWSNCEASNLRFLCPNCHSQTDTFCGRKNKKEHLCQKCGNQTSTRLSKICMSCYEHSAPQINLHLRKSKRPSYEQLLKETQELGFVATGRKYGVTDNAIRKWVKFYEKYN